MQISLHILSLFILSFGILIVKCIRHESCDLILAPSSLFQAGRGVFAGRSYEAEEDIEIVPTITIPHEIVLECQLNNYVFGTNDVNYDMILYGSGSLYNHHDHDRSVQHYWSDEDEELKDPHDDINTKILYSNYTANLLRVTKSINAGDELFENYGDGWFEQRFSSSTNEEASNTISWRDLPTTDIVDSLLRRGHCLSDVKIDQSSIPGAGRGLFAKRTFEEGEVVTISPVLTLPYDIVQKSESKSLLMNYCFGRSDSKVVLMPLGYSPMMNHNNNGYPNINLTWFMGENGPSVLEKNPEELFESSFAPLDISFIAMRPIAVGEELFIDYGPNWQQCINTLQDDIQSNLYETQCFSSITGGFRQFLSSANHLYPPHWLI